MTKRDFFVLSLKLLGLWTLIAAFSSILGSFIVELQSDEEVSSNTPMIVFLISLFAASICLIYFSKNIVEILRLDKGFDDDRIEIGNFSSKDVVRIGSYLIGGPMFINACLGIVYYIIRFFDNKVGDYTENLVDTSLLMNVLKLLVGYLLITEYERIAIYLHKNRSKE